MSNIIDNLLLTESTTAINVNSVVEQPNKDKPSLFDSLLSNISSSSEELNVDSSTSKIEIKTIDINAESNSLLNNVESLENIESTESLDGVKITPQTVESKEQKITTGSLLDKLVIEAKKSVVTEQTNKDMPSLFDSLLSNISSSEEIAQNPESLSVESKVESTSTVNSKIVSDILTNKGEVDNLQNIDLSIDTKIPANTQNSDLVEELKNNILIKPIKSSEESSISAENILNVDTKIDIQDINIDISASNQELISNEMSHNVKLNISNENMTKKEETIVSSISLLDKLVVDAKKNIKEVTNNIISDTNNLLNVAESVLDENSVLKEQNNLKLQNIETEDLTLINNSLLEQEIVNVTDNKISEVKNKIVDEITILEKDKVEISVVNLTSKTNVSLSNLVTINNINPDKTIDEVNNLVDLKLQNGTSDITNTLSDEVAIINSENNEFIIENKTEPIQIKKDEKLSLMDQLIQKNSEKVTLIDSVNNNGMMDSSTKEIITKDLISSIYLGSQKNKINNQTLFNKNEALSIVKEGNSIQAVKTSAEMLDLGLEDMALDESIDIDKLDLKQLNTKDTVESLLLQKNVKSEEVKSLITQSVEASKALLEDTLTISSDATVNVNSPIAYNIQSKIIGAKQQMSAMMSDIARQMYENYKPPVTAFKINLNPTELGSIAILMKSDKNSGLSISMNVSNNVTLDTLIENQNVLKNSLNKTFDENTKFNLDFGSSNQNSNQSSNNQNQSSNRQFEQQMGTQAILQLKEENKDIEEKAIDYM